MSINFSITSLNTKLLPLARMIRRYVILIFILGVLSVVGFLVFKINTLAKSEPPDDVLLEKQGQFKPISIDRRAVERIRQLEATNIEVKSLFEQARDNPFQE